MEEYIIYKCIIGSRAYGLDNPNSDIDVRGIYLPPTEMVLSLDGVPEQIEKKFPDEVYWELGKFVRLALQANPNILECLYTPKIGYASALMADLLEIRDIFLSKRVYKTYGGYAQAQLKKLQNKKQKNEEINWKHAMHLIRLLLCGITTLRDGYVPVNMGNHRELLLEIREGKVTLDWVLRLNKIYNEELDDALRTTTLPDEPDYEAANEFLLQARRSAM